MSGQMPVGCFMPESLNWKANSVRDFKLNNNKLFLKLFFLNLIMNIIYMLGFWFSWQRIFMM
jgi:hypothetical protein